MRVSLLSWLSLYIFIYLLTSLYILFSPNCFRFIKRIINCPFHSNWLCASFSNNLIKHCFSCKFCIISMTEFDICNTLLTIKSDIFHFSKRRKIFIDCSYHVSFWCQRISRQLNISYQQSSAFFVERTNSSVVFFKRSMSCSTKYIS